MYLFVAASVSFSHELGLDYVSCSPFRVPIARFGHRPSRAEPWPQLPKRKRFVLLARPHASGDQAIRNVATSNLVFDYRLRRNERDRCSDRSKSGCHAGEEVVDVPAQIGGYISFEAQTGARTRSSRPGQTRRIFFFKKKIYPRQATVATVLHQPLIETDDMKWRLAGQSATTILNCAAQAGIVLGFALARVVR